MLTIFLIMSVAVNCLLLFSIVALYHEMFCTKSDLSNEIKRHSNTIIAKDAAIHELSKIQKGVARFLESRDNEYN